MSVPELPIWASFGPTSISPLGARTSPTSSLSAKKMAYPPGKGVPLLQAVRNSRDNRARVGSVRAFIGVSVCSTCLLVVAEQLHHGPAHGFADVHVDFGLAAVVTVAAAALCHGMRVDGRDVAFELGILPRVGVHGEMALQHFAAVAAAAF